MNERRTSVSGHLGPIVEGETTKIVPGSDGHLRLRDTADYAHDGGGMDDLTSPP